MNGHSLCYIEVTIYLQQLIKANHVCKSLCYFEPLHNLLFYIIWMQIYIFFKFISYGYTMLFCKPPKNKNCGFCFFSIIITTAATVYAVYLFYLICKTVPIFRQHLLMGKLRLRVIKQLAEGHSSGEGGHWTTLAPTHKEDILKSQQMTFVHLPLWWAELPLSLGNLKSFLGLKDKVKNSQVFIPWH